MTVVDFYRVIGIDEKIEIKSICKENDVFHFKILYKGSVDELPLNMLELNVLDIRVSNETLNMTITVE